MMIRLTHLPALLVCLFLLGANRPGAPKSKPPPAPDFTGHYDSGPANSPASYRVLVVKTAAGYDCHWHAISDDRLIWLGELRHVGGQWIEYYGDRSPCRCADYGWIIADGCPAQIVRDGSYWWIGRR